jgi:hypothetical protein
MVVAQLRDMLAAEDSSVVAKKNDNSRILLPQSAQTDLLAVWIGENDAR